MTTDLNYPRFTGKQAQGPASRLQAALAALDPTSHRILALRFAEGRSTADIATLLGYSVARVQRLQHLALAELQRLVAA